MILDQHGRPISTAQEVSVAHISGGDPRAARLGPGVETGWRDGRPGQDPGFPSSRFGISRTDTRQTCRALYFTNGLFKAAVDITAAFLVGDALTYGTFADPDLQTFVDEFWQANSFGQLVCERLIVEWFLDGELAVVFPTGTDQPAPDVPALIGMLDVDDGGFSLDASTTRGALPGDMVYRLKLDRLGEPLQTWEAGAFAWTANDSLWNDPRGWPVAMAAADAAIAYISMLNMRLNVHHVQQRVLAVYKAYLDPLGKKPDGTLDGGIYDWRAKTRAFGRMPKDGAVLPLVIRPAWKDAAGNSYDGVTESLDFMKPASGASDAASDMQMMLRLVGLGMGGLPEHYLGVGGGTTRTTAESMGVPTVRLANRRQASLAGLITRILRSEVRRRGGRDRKYRVSKGSRKKLPIDLIEFPLVFPVIREETMTEIVARVKLALDNSLISDQTATGDLGYDPATERERKADQDAEPAAKPKKPAQTGNTNDSQPQS